MPMLAVTLGHAMQLCQLKDMQTTVATEQTEIFFRMSKDT